MQATRAIIHLENLRRNIEAARKQIGPHPKICMPVKAGAYGHGAVPVSRFALESGVEYLGVSSVMEGAELRSGGINAPVMVFAQALGDELPLIAQLDLIPFVSDADFIVMAAAAAEEAKKTITVHLKVDTGMGRMGCHPNEAASLAAKIVSSNRLKLGGVATHLAVSDSTDSGDIAYTKKQLNVFRECLSSIKNSGIDPGLAHAANSGGLAFHEDSYFDMIRPGIFLYGYSPAKEGGLTALPLMELQSAVVFMRNVKKGEAISYGRTWTAPKDTCIGVIPAGYADGFTRGLSNNHSILIRGKAYPLAGRICMDQCMVDLGPNPEVERWDKAVIFGPGFLNAADVAAKLNTIPYEITCNINKRVLREYTNK